MMTLATGGKGVLLSIFLSGNEYWMEGKGQKRGRKEEPDMIFPPRKSALQLRLPPLTGSACALLVVFSTVAAPN